MWGRYPLDFHGCTEAVIIATQTWDHQGMTFVPNLNFFEFIPEEECLRSMEDPLYQPCPILLDEVTPGDYELVITSFHGGPFIRYRLGHLIRINSLRNEKLDIDIPQMSFISRVDDMIDIAGFTRLSEKTIWQAIEKSGVSYKGWTARKEVKGKPVLHLYLELSENGYLTSKQVAAAVHEQLKKLNKPYAEMEEFIKLQPLKVTLVPENAFHSYELARKKAGAKGSQVQIPHVNPSEGMIDSLLNSARQEAVSEPSPLEAVHSR
jgi:phenylacetate-coenzyme A ligase PaaK-like adenylate-forming protein